MRVLSLGTLVLGSALLCSAAYSPGAKVENFTVKDLKGNTVSLSDQQGQTTVVIFISTKCPISNDYNERMNALYKDYQSKGIRFLFINSNMNEPVSEIEEHAKAQGFAFAVYKDDQNVVADTFGAQFTPEAYVIDKAGVLRYHGHIDDSRNPARIQSRTLRSALDAVLAGKPVERSETKAFGCTIKRVKKAS